MSQIIITMAFGMSGYFFGRYLHVFLRHNKVDWTSFINGTLINIAIWVMLAMEAP